MKSRFVVQIQVVERDQTGRGEEVILDIDLKEFDSCGDAISRAQDVRRKFEREESR